MKKMNIKEMAGIGLKGQELKDFEAKGGVARYFNVKLIQQLSFDEFKKKLSNWGVPQDHIDKKTGKKVKTRPIVEKPTEAELKAVYNAITGNDPGSVEPKK